MEWMDEFDREQEARLLPLRIAACFALLIKMPPPGVFQRAKRFITELLNLFTR